MNKNILITGGTGLVGRRLTEMLLDRGYQVSYLSRGKYPIPRVKVYQWDVSRRFIETGAIEEADYIINLAGAGVAEERWTEERRKELLESRTLSTRLIGEKLQAVPNRVKALINASAVGIYGVDTGNEMLTEDSPAADDFLARVVKAWEHEADQIASTGLRVVKVRIGIVLSEKGGALKQMALPVKMYAGAALGTGKQYLSWIHIDDLCNFMIKAVEDENVRGIYNGVAPAPVDNREMTRAIAGVLHRPLILPDVPAFVLKMAMGEMAGIALGGNRVSSEKVEKTGFKFKFTTVSHALRDLLEKKK